MPNNSQPSAIDAWKATAEATSHLVGFLEGAAATAVLALAGKILFDCWTRGKERRALAAGIAGELGAYLSFLNIQTLASFREIAEKPRAERIEFFRIFPALPSSHPVFDVVADKIGWLSPDDARDISRIYNVVSGFRLLSMSMSSQAFQDATDDAQTGRMNVIADMMERELPIAAALVTRLHRAAGHSRWDWLRPVWND